MHLRAEVTEKLMVLIFKILLPLHFDKVFAIALLISLKLLDLLQFFWRFSDEKQRDLENLLQYSLTYIFFHKIFRVLYSEHESRTDNFSS